jgi:hypothetical protein
MRALHALPRLAALALLPFALGACSTLLHDGPLRPETVLRRTYADAPQGAVISALQQAAFDAGYTPAYAHTDDGFYAYELFDRHPIAPDRLRRLEALVLRVEGGTTLQLRIHSVDADDGARYSVQKADRAFAREFVAALDAALPLRSSR